MRCLYCGKELALLKRLRGGGEFCSDAHRQQYRQEYDQLALSRLLQTTPDSPQDTGPESGQASKGVSPHGHVPAGAALARTGSSSPARSLPPPKQGSAAPLPSSSRALSPAPGPSVAPVSSTPAPALPSAPEPAPSARVDHAKSAVSSPDTLANPQNLEARQLERRMPEPTAQPLIAQPRPAKAADEIPPPAPEAGFLEELPEPVEVAAGMRPAALELMQSAAPMLPSRNRVTVATHVGQLAPAGPVVIGSGRATEYIGAPRGRGVEVREFAKPVPVVTIHLAAVASTSLTASSSPLPIVVGAFTPASQGSVWTAAERPFADLEIELGDLARMDLPADQSATGAAFAEAEPMQAPPVETLPVAPLRADASPAESEEAEAAPVGASQFETVGFEPPAVEVGAPVEFPLVEAFPSTVVPGEPQAVEPVASGQIVEAPAIETRHELAMLEMRTQPSEAVPVMTEPAAAEPAAAEPATAEPATAEPASAEPATAEPAPAEPVIREPIAREPIAQEPIAPQQITPQRITAEPTVVNEPFLTRTHTVSVQVDESRFPVYSPKSAPARESASTSATGADRPEALADRQKEDRREVPVAAPMLAHQEWARNAKLAPVAAAPVVAHSPVETAVEAQLPVPVPSVEPEPPAVDAPREGAQPTIPRPTQSLPLDIAAIAPGRGRAVQVFSTPILSATAMQIPRTAAMPLRPAIVFASAPPEKPAAGPVKAGPTLKSTPAPPVAAPPAGARLAGAAARPTAPKPAVARPAAKLKGVAARKAESLMPLEAMAADQAGDNPIGAQEAPAEPAPPAVDFRRPTPLAPAVISLDLGLPTLRAQDSFWSRLPAAAKIGIAAVIVLAVTGIVYLATSDQKASARSAPSTKPVTVVPGKPIADLTWMVDWAPDPDQKRGRRLSIMRGSMPLSDYRLEFQAQIEHKALGWVYRALDARNFYVNRIEIVTPGLDPQIALVRFAVLNGQEQPRIAWPLKLKVHLDTLYKVRFEAVQDKFTTWIGDEKIDQWADTHLRSGGVGIYAEKGESTSVKGNISLIPLVVKE